MNVLLTLPVEINHFNAKILSYLLSWVVLVLHQIDSFLSQYSDQFRVLTGVEGFTTQEDQEELGRIEKQLKRRFAIGTQVSEHCIVQDFLRQVKWNTKYFQ